MMEIGKDHEMLAVSETVEDTLKAVSTIPPPEPIDKEAEKRLKRKIDFLILPMLCGTYFLSSIGKSDLAFAAVAGLIKELKMTPSEYSAAANYFLVGFIVFQLPGTLLLRIIGPNRQTGIACVAWGLFTCLQVLIHTYSALAGLRTLIGICEGFGNAVVLYLSFWYTYDELATRSGIFWGSTALASSFNGLISYGITKHLNGKHGWLAWRWIFLIEGILPIGFGIFLYLYLPSTPEKAKFGFSQADRELATKRSRRAHNPEGPKLRSKLMVKSLLSPIFWLFNVIFAGYHFCNASISLFTLVIIKGLGYTDAHALLMSSLVFACAFVGVLAFCRIADVTGKRAWTLCASLVPTVVGYIMLLASENPKVRYGGVCLVAFGNFPGAVLIISWLTMLVAGYTKRATILAVINMIGQALSIAGNFAYEDPPYYRKGIAASLAMTAVEVAGVIATWFYLKWRNARKEQEKDSLQAAERRQIDLDIIGEDHPDFRFTL